MGARDRLPGTAALILLVTLALGGGAWRWTATAPEPAWAPVVAPGNAAQAVWPAGPDRALTPADGALGRTGPVPLTTGTTGHVAVEPGPYDLEFACVGTGGGPGLLYITPPGRPPDLVGFGCASRPETVRSPFYAGQAGVVTVHARATAPHATGAWQVLPVPPVRWEWPRTARTIMGDGSAAARLEVALPALAGDTTERLGPVPAGRYRAEVVCVGEGAAAITTTSRIPPRVRHIRCDGLRINYPVGVGAGDHEVQLVLERSWGTGYLVWRLVPDG